jgi:hypothetical protein
MNTLPHVLAIYADRLEARTDKAGDCWTWQGATTAAGYGAIKTKAHGLKYTHRIAYEAEHGSIPDGMHIDHVCHNQDATCAGGPCAHRACVNPAHLEAVSKATNDKRGKSVLADNKRKTHCIRGHAFTAANTYLHRQGTSRRCRTCHSMHESARKRGQKLGG